MKPANKLMLTAAEALLIGGGAYLNYRMAQQPKEELSDLTLANLEALGVAMQRDVGQITTCPYPAEPYATCTEITRYPDGKYVTVLMYGRSAIYTPNLPVY